MKKKNAILNFVVNFLNFDFIIMAVSFAHCTKKVSNDHYDVNTNSLVKSCSL